MARTIAIVEDEAAIRDNYADAFTRQGYQVQAHGDRRSALTSFSARLPDLAIIDIGLGDEPEGGFDLCRELRSMSATIPIIFLTARDSDLDTISGFRLGADDYLTKDVSLAHLSARIAALFRRVDALRNLPGREESIQRGDLSVDLRRMCVSWRGRNVALTVTEFWIVHALALHPGHVKSRAQLMQDANVVVDDNTVTTHVKRIRRKFTDIDPQFSCIESVYAVGYRWVGS